MRKLVEGKDYSIHEYITKNKKMKCTKAICPTCEQCQNKKLCLNRKTLFTMNMCEKCKNCRDKENCDKFYIYVRYTAELLNLGRNATTGELIRKQFNANSKEEAFNKLKEYVEKISECGMKEKVYQPNEKSIVTIAKEIANKRLKKGEIKANTYLRLLQTIQAISVYKFANVPIQNVTRNQIVVFLDAERYKANSTIQKEYRLLKTVFYYSHKIVKEDFFEGHYKIECPKSYKSDSKISAFTRKEEFILTEYIKNNENEYNLIILLALYTRYENRRNISITA